MRLATEDLRRQTLAIHADHSKWEDTPYISFTKSPTVLQSLAAYRATRRPDQSVIVVDPLT
jgi:hypothetical protein